MEGTAEDMEPFLNKPNSLFLYSLRDCFIRAKHCLVITSESLNSFINPNDIKKDLISLARFIINLKIPSPAIKYFFNIVGL
jgi:hypothetical protein